MTTDWRPFRWIMLLLCHISKHSEACMLLMCPFELVFLPGLYIYIFWWGTGSYCRGNVLWPEDQTPERIVVLLFNTCQWALQQSTCNLLAKGAKKHPLVSFLILAHNPTYSHIWSLYINALDNYYLFGLKAMDETRVGWVVTHETWKQDITPYPCQYWHQEYVLNNTDWSIKWYHMCSIFHYTYQRFKNGPMDVLSLQTRHCFIDCYISFRATVKFKSTKPAFFIHFFNHWVFDFPHKNRDESRQDGSVSAKTGRGIVLSGHYPQVTVKQLK